MNLDDLHADDEDVTASFIPNKPIGDLAEINRITEEKQASAQARGGFQRRNLEPKTESKWDAYKIY